MLECSSYLRNQLSLAYENARKKVTSAAAEREYIRLAKEGSQVARDTLFNLYIPFVISYARSSTYSMYKGDMGDLIGAAALGFSRAIELFDMSLGYEFGCFYKWHIRNAMNKEMYGDSLVAVPENLIKPSRDENGNPVNKNPVTIVSGDSPVGDDDSRTTLMETIASEGTDVVGESEENDRHAIVAELLETLPEIEHDAISAMVMGATHVSSREWGERHGCSHEWARKVKNRALKRLREKMGEIYIDDKMAV